MEILENGKARECRIYALNYCFICNTQLTLLIDIFFVSCAQYTMLFSTILNDSKRSKGISCYTEHLSSILYCYVSRQSLC